MCSTCDVALEVCLFQTEHCAAGGRRKEREGEEEHGRMEWVAKETDPRQTLGETCDDDMHTEKGESSP